jgi:hypothetical protein
VKNLSIGPLKGRLIDVPTNIRLGWKGLTLTNTLAYCELSITINSNDKIDGS